MKYLGKGLVVVVMAGWMTHIIHCIADDRWGMLIAGGVVFPVGIVHGIGIWFGLF